MKYTNNPIADKSFDFSVRIVKLYQYLCSEKKEFVLSKQILRSGTSVGANIEEAIGGYTKKILDINFLSPTKKLEKQNIGFEFFIKRNIFQKNYSKVYLLMQKN